MSLTESTRSDNEKMQTQQDITQPTLRGCVETALEMYFIQLDGQPVTKLYDLVIAEVEAPLLEAVMNHTQGNQTQASILLGLNRGTLRKKLKTYGL